MQLSLELGKADANRIVSYQPGHVVINAEIYTRSLIVMPTQLISDWGPQELVELKEQDLLKIIHLEPEIVLLGVGDELKFPSPQLISLFTQRGIGIEIMNNSAACRTYNVLMSEERRVVAALLIKIQ